MIRSANLLQAPTLSIYQLVKTITFVLYLFDMVEMNKMKWKNEMKNEFSKMQSVTINLILAQVHDLHIGML